VRIGLADLFQAIKQREAITIKAMMPIMKSGLDGENTKLEMLNDMEKDNRDL